MSGYPVKPLPRWTILPDDPEPLRNWLLRQAEVDEAQVRDDSAQQRDPEGRAA